MTPRAAGTLQGRIGVGAPVPNLDGAAFNGF
jgi:hypothetical protein